MTTRQQETRSVARGGLSLGNQFTPIYFRIQETIRRSIVDGKFLPGDRLPSETELARDYQTTRVTVRHALSRLAYEGLIVKQPGRGTFVALPSSIVSPIDTMKVRSFEEQVAQRGRTVSYSDARYKLVSSAPDEALRLNLAATAHLYRLDRLRRIDGRTVGVEVRYFPPELGSEVTSEMLEHRSAHEFLCEILGHPIPVIEVTLTAITANQTLAKRIGVKPGAALQVRCNIFRDVLGKVVQCGKSYFRGEIQMAYTLGKNSSITV
jgi:GntR family transcriptional regulator